MKSTSPFDDVSSKIKEIITLKIINFISYKPRSQKEISDRLDKYLGRYKKINSQEKTTLRDDVLKHLQEVNLVDDDYFAQTFVAQKLRSPKPESKIKIRQFLMRKGVPTTIIDKAMKAYSDETEEEKMIKDARKKLSTLRNTPPLRKRKKLYEYLARKGYPFSRIRAIVDRELEVK